MVKPQQPATPSIPEGYALINLEHLPDMALVPLLRSLKMVGQQASVISRWGKEALGVDPSFVDNVLAKDIREANAAAIAISDEMARRGMNEQAVRDEMLAKAEELVLRNKAKREGGQP